MTAGDHAAPTGIKARRTSHIFSTSSSNQILRYNGGMNLTKDDVIQRAIGIYHSEGSIDMVKLAQALDIDVYAKEGDDTFNSEISFDKTADKFFIIVNANHPLVRQRFSIAHELAHYIFHPEKIRKEGYMNREIVEEVNKKSEEEADSFAAEILMPEELVNDYVEEHSLKKNVKMTEEIINSIADHFKVSRTVALLRMRHLGYYVPYITFS
jgi:Zn-dependent peptidase ImmA (M78 family)